MAPRYSPQVAAGIAERVASCGGSLTVGPIPGAEADGFAVTARLPSR
jgi:hypothetical protein